MVAVFNRAFNENCKVYYAGTKQEWYRIGWQQNMAIDYDFVYFYSENEPLEEGNYWRYDDGEITVWDSKLEQ